MKIDPTRSLSLALVLLAACGEAMPAPNTPASHPSQPPTAPAVSAPSPAPPAHTPPDSATVAAPRTAPDRARIAAATGGTPETNDDTVKVSFPRDDIPVAIDGWKMPPFMGLTSWAAFVVGTKAGVEAMVMGDIVLFEDEVNPAMSAAFANGLDVTALHNHFFFDKPRVYFMHIGGEGDLDQLGKGVRAMLDAQKAVRKNAAQPATSSGGPALPAVSKIDAARLDAAFGVKGQTKDGMYKAVWGRKTQAACGCSVGKAMGVNTWAAFAGTDESAGVAGDFAVTEAELQPVLRSLRAAGINIVAIHSHMTQESPRILFFHYWGRGKATDLASSLKKALELTAWDGRGPTT